MTPERAIEILQYTIDMIKNNIKNARIDKCELDVSGCAPSHIYGAMGRYTMRDSSQSLDLTLAVDMPGEIRRECIEGAY